MSSGLPGERFDGKRDAWLVALLWGASLVDFAIAAWLAFGVREAPGFVAPLLVAAGLFQLHALHTTYLAFEGDALVAHASFFRWRVPLGAIDAVEPTHDPRSSPALSLDRLRIRYGAKQILVAPADRAGFLRALAARAPGLVVEGESARRASGAPGATRSSAP